jgi:hypothetical protein
MNLRSFKIKRQATNESPSPWVARMIGVVRRGPRCSSPLGGEFGVPRAPSIETPGAPTNGSSRAPSIETPGAPIPHETRAEHRDNPGRQFHLKPAPSIEPPHGRQFSNKTQRFAQKRLARNPKISPQSRPILPPTPLFIKNPPQSLPLPASHSKIPSLFTRSQIPARKSRRIPFHALRAPKTPLPNQSKPQNAKFFVFQPQLDPSFNLKLVTFITCLGYQFAPKALPANDHSDQ